MDTAQHGPELGSPRTVAPARRRRWALWSVPPRARSFILGVEFAACALTAFLLLNEQLVALDAARAALLVGLSTLFSEAANLVERLRRYLHLGSTDRAWSNSTSVWTFAAALLLPAGYAAVVVAAVYGHILLGSWRHRNARPYRICFSAATTVLGVYAAIAVQQLTGIRPVLGSAASAGVTLLALLVYTTVSLVATIIAAYLVRRSSTVRAVLPSIDAVGFELATLVLGVVTAAFMVSHPWLIPGIFVLVAVLHRSALVKELEVAARTDAKTGLLTASAWHELGQQHLERAGRTGERTAVLMIDLDHFKRVNDEFGHLVGDLTLRSVADALKSELRSYDALGRFGGDEFVAVLDGVGRDEAVAIAVRLTEAIRALAPFPAKLRSAPALTASIGVANFPAEGTSLDAVTAAADAALYVAKRDGRDCVRHADDVAPTGAGLTQSSPSDRRLRGQVPQSRSLAVPTSEVT